MLRGHIWLLCELARLLRRLLLLTSRCKLRRLLPKLSRLLGRLARCPRLILLGRGSVLRRLRPEMLRRALLLLALLGRTLLGLALGLLAGRA